MTRDELELKQLAYERKRALWRKQIAMKMCGTGEISFSLVPTRFRRS